MSFLLFFLSGIAGLIYQVVWVRVFGNVFGNTVYSASLVVAVFMLGLGAGSYVVGRWADRRYESRPDSLLAWYGYFELLIAALGFGISLVLPHLSVLSSFATSYTRSSNGWYVLSSATYLGRAAIAVTLLMPITLLMGGTLTLLIRHLVRSDVEMGVSRVAILYAVNTGGAALGCFLTDFALVPAWGLLNTQLVAVLLNAVAGGGAIAVARRTHEQRPSARRGAQRSVRLEPDVVSPQPLTSSPLAIPFTALALAMSGFAAMGMEILWFRHASILLGGFRAVFSLLLTVILIGIGAGSLVSSVLLSRTRRPGAWLMVSQALFAAFALLGFATADARRIELAVSVDRLSSAAGLEHGFARTLAELWFNAKPILLDAGVPALLMGLSFPLANAMIQRAELSVGRRAGALYFSNTCGAVCGSLVAGFLLLPALGIQASATILTVIAALAVVPLALATRPALRPAFAASMLIATVAVGLWLRLPSTYVIARAAPPLGNERLLARSEGVTEVVAVADVTGEGRTLLTNGHPMSSTSWLSQRYMRALAHIPLLSIDNPETVLVIGFGVGNTTHAATLHPSIRRVEVADLSAGILSHASYFADVNRGVLNDPRVAVYVNDGRHHLQMQPPGSYDLITLEPPPIGYAGVASLYSREFYALARTRLTPRGYMSQWLPAYQVPAETTLAMVRAFVDVFPHAVLISGAEADLLLIGTQASGIEIDPVRLRSDLARAPDVQADLQRLDLGTPREIVGTFVASAQTMAAATRETPPATDDRPLQEYSVRSLLDFGEAVPASLVDLRDAAAWCPACFVDGRPSPAAEGLDTYLALAGRAYAASPAEMARVRRAAGQGRRVIAGSAYLGAIVPESADVHNILGIALAEKGQIGDAIGEFREAVRLEPRSAQSHWHLGAALAYSGDRIGAIEHLLQSVQIDPNNPQARHDLDVVLDRRRQRP